MHLPDEFGQLDDLTCSRVAPGFCYTNGLVSGAHALHILTDEKSAGITPV